VSELHIHGSNVAVPGEGVAGDLGAIDLGGRGDAGSVCEGAKSVGDLDAAGACGGAECSSSAEVDGVVEKRSVFPFWRKRMP
jgi:hypothetical protein